MVREALERGRSDEQGLLFDSTVKLLLLAGFLELVLYRLVSRLGMHLSKLAQQHEWLRLTFKALSAIGFALLNFVSLLLFLALFLLLFNKVRAVGGGRYDTWLVPAVSLLVLVTVAFLLFPPAMIGSVVYNLVFSVVLVVLIAEYVATHPSWPQRGMILCYGLGITGWLYYQTVSTTYGLLKLTAVPPLVHEVNRAGEALMVLASILVFWAYGSTSFWTKNKRQRRRAAIFGVVGGSTFVALLFLDYFLGLYDKALAESIRKAGEGIGWIFQMGMGYTFYLPFAFYVAGLLCWAYTVVKLLAIGRLAGYGLGLMFIAGYALQLSHLSLMVVLGLMLLNLDKRRVGAPVGEPVQEGLIAGPTVGLVSEQTT
ncbi:MAG: hypothetical protein EPO64_02525 [Nitrospirae bacterium]|nr:MAG: hypothetical protein EPO64_02525 [Nitrospirota bacterium]